MFFEPQKGQFRVHLRFLRLLRSENNKKMTPCKFMQRVIL